jgi:hypothetical protein
MNHNYQLLETDMTRLLEGLKEVFTPDEVAEVQEFLT